MRQILDHAAENNYGVPAFNINDMEQIIAVLQAAKKVNAPVILQTSTGARKFAGDPMIRHMVAAGIEMFPELPICLHQDHGSSVDICQSAIVNGYSSVMMDGSLEADGKTPSALWKPVKAIKKTVTALKALSIKNVWLPIRTRQPALLPKPSWMLWPLLSVLLTALINSPVNRMVKFWLLTSLKKFTKNCRIPIWLCTVHPLSRRNCRI